MPFFTLPGIILIRELRKGSLTARIGFFVISLKGIAPQAPVAVAFGLRNLGA